MIIMKSVTDTEKKEKEKVYADSKRRAASNDITPGDRVLMKRNKENKLSANYHPNPLKVLEKNGNSILLESQDGVRYKRNITHVKKFVESKKSSNMPNENSVVYENNVPNEEYVEIENSSVQDSNGSQNATETLARSNRPIKQRVMPAKFKDYVMS